MVKNFKIRFIIRSNRASLVNKSLVPIYARIIVNGQRAEFATKLLVENAKWDSQNSRVIGRDSESKQINLKLQRITREISEIVDERTKGRKKINAQLIKSSYFGETEGELGIIRLTEIFIKANKIELAEGSLKNYRYTYRALQNYLKYQYRQAELVLEDLTMKFAYGFERYLKQKTACNQNGAMKHIQRLKAILNFGVRNEYLKNNPVSTFQISFKKSHRAYLNQEELNNLEKLQVKIPRLVNIKSLFLFACYTGLSYIEVKNLRVKNIGVEKGDERWIYTTRQKTGTIEDVPLLPKAEKILDNYLRFHSSPNDLIFPTPTNQVMNRYLKELAEVAGIYKNITFHSARHTFATTVTLANGLPLETLQAFLGHASVKTTQIYAQIVRDKASRDFQALKAKISG